MASWHLRKLISLFVLALTLVVPLSGRPVDDTTKTSGLRSKAIALYLDCRRCDSDFIRSDITFVNFVRDRNEAQVHLLVSTQETGSGGTQYTLNFIGLREFEGIDDTLEYHTRDSDTDESVRAGLSRVMKLGLVRYATNSPLADYLTLSFSLPSEPTATIDPWNNWVFKVGLNGYSNGESSNEYYSTGASISAVRITPEMKIEQYLHLNYNESRIKLPDRLIKNVRRNKGYTGSVVWSLGDHWGSGFIGGVSSSVYNNLKLNVRAGPGIEYNIFPYSESTRRQCRIGYTATLSHVEYEEETLYDKTKENLVMEELSVSLELVEPWGSSDLRLSGSHYFHDAKKYGLGLNGGVSIRVVEGLSFNINGNFSQVRNQLSLPKHGASLEEVLLQRSELETDYYYYASFGFSYSFGSIYNNVVNARFGD